MSRRELERSGTKDRSLVRMESRTAGLSRQLGDRAAALEAGALSGARLLTGLALTSSAQNIEHGLGREWKGAILVKTSDAVVLRTTSTQTDSKWIGLAALQATADALTGDPFDVVVF